MSGLESLFGGFASGANQGVTDLRQNMLNAAMLSRKLQMENDANSIPADQYNKVISQASKWNAALMNGQEAPNIDASGITHPKAQALFGSLVNTEGKLGAGLSKTTNRLVDKDGKQVMLTMDRRGNIIREASQGLDKSSQDAIRKAKMEFEDANGIISQIEDQVKKIYTAHDIPGLLKQNANMTFEQLAQTNPEVKAYLDSRGIYSQRLEKLTTGSSRFAAELAKQALNEIPGKNDMLATGLLKTHNVRNIFNSKLNAAINTYSQSPSSILAAAQPGGGLSGTPDLQQMAAQELARRRAQGK